MNFNDDVTHGTHRTNKATEEKDQHKSQDTHKASHDQGGGPDITRERGHLCACFVIVRAFLGPHVDRTRAPKKSAVEVYSQIPDLICSSVGPSFGPRREK